MKTRELLKLGIGRGEALRLAQELLERAADQGVGKRELRDQMRAVAADPAAHLRHPHFAELARLLTAAPVATAPEREGSAPWRQWGDNIDEAAVTQMRNACRLPISVSGALMPDAHVGYGLPIGGVLATDGAVIPYAVGVDIACRMRLTVLDLPVHTLVGERQRLVKTLESETRFGVGATFRQRKEHPVMERDWGASPVTRHLSDKAHAQLGTSGSGNHFVEFGRLVLEHAELGLAPGEYLALLSHSGSRGVGNEVARHYSQLAMHRHPGLPRDLHHLAWLELASADGEEYWAAMQLMGAYAAANHELIHHELLRALHARALATVENHHNFAWKETHDGRQVIVHRKGATPAGVGALAVIPGSMATPAYVVRGKGSAAALSSAAHGAGRVMSRKQAKQLFTASAMRRQLESLGITLLSAGTDEAPGVYKDIDAVMRAQQDLVEIVARFEPRIVKMAPAGERAED